MPEDGISSHGIGGCLEPDIQVLEKRESKRKRHNAKSLLRRASAAARAGNSDRAATLRNQAEELVGPSEVHVICEQQRFSFARALAPQVPQQSVKHGFVR